MIDGIEGIAPRETVFNGEQELPGQVFAAEILKRPVLLQRDGDGICATVDRTGVTHAVYTTAGKNRLCRRVLSGPALEEAVHLDREIHRFMMGAGDASTIEIPTEKFPLRWASGGVLPIVTWQGETWSPFFFRDIPPVGWNIAAGSSESEEELLRPLYFGLREFIEETIVLSRPPKPGVQIAAKTFPRLLEDNGAQLQRALETVNRHLAIRSREDGLTLMPFDGDGVAADREISARFVPTRTRLRVRTESGVEELANLIVCFNLLELGIEVMSIVRYDLDENDYLLDGEMLTPAGGKTELIRMPVALISHAYLEEVFGGGQMDLDYQQPALIDYDRSHDVWKQVRSEQPSVMPARPVRSGEIAVFCWDVDRRAELATGPLGDTRWKKDPMRIRHRKWGKTFTRYFEMGGMIGTPSVAYPYFTAGSAKTVAYYLAQTGGSRPATTNTREDQ
jgi:hypothetical protein